MIDEDGRAAFDGGGNDDAAPDPAEDTQDGSPNQEQEENEDRAEIEAEARKLGWKPKDDWKGDTSGWVDADEYLERLNPAKLRQTIDQQQAEIARLKDQYSQQQKSFESRLARMDKMNQANMTRQRDQLMTQIKAAQRQAAEAGDMEAFDYYQNQETELTERFGEEDQQLASTDQTQPQMHPAAVNWLKRNPGVRYNQERMQAAVDFCGEYLADNPNASVEDQLSYAEERLNEVWPGTIRKRGNGKTNGRDPGFGGSGEKQRGPQLESGQRQASGQPRQKGWNDIPSDERKILDRHIREGLYKDKTDAAKTYWS